MRGMYQNTSFFSAAARASASSSSFPRSTAVFGRIGRGWPGSSAAKPSVIHGMAVSIWAAARAIESSWAGVSARQTERTARRNAVRMEGPFRVPENRFYPWLRLPPDRVPQDHQRHPGPVGLPELVAVHEATVDLADLQDV